MGRDLLDSGPGPPLMEDTMTATPEVVRLADRLRPAAPPERPLKIFFWPANLEDGCATYRIKIPGAELSRLGHEVRISQRMDAEAREDADVIVGQRLATAPPSAMWQLLCAEAKRQGRRRMVYEVDDDLFNIDPTVNPHAEMFHIPAVRTNMIDNLRAADLVTVTTEPLAAVLRQWNRNVAVIPNAVRAEVFDIPAPSRRGKDAGRIVYGWQGSATHHQDWLQAEEAMFQLLTTDGVSQLRFLGTPHWGRLVSRGVAVDRIDALGWTTDISAYYKRVSKFDVTLAPLADTTFNRSKSGLRVQESLALGIPVVASNVPAYRPWVRHGVDGFLVDTPEEWLEALRAFADPGLRRTMGEAGRLAAVAWSVEATAHRWVDAYRTLQT